MRDAVIVDGVRTPFGKHHGSFRDTHPQNLAAAPLTALRERNGFDPTVIEDVQYGCVKPVFEQGSNIGRIAPMVAGWGDSVPGHQLDRQCGSGQQAVHNAVAHIKAGFHDVLIAGGVEHMTRVPMDSNRTGDNVRPIEDMSETYFEFFDELTSQGEGAERIAEQWDLSRTRLDELAVDSQSRWGEAWEAGFYEDHVTPVATQLDGEAITVERDEHPRPDTTVETLADLPLAFRSPDEGGVIHAGNASGIVDGSAALLLADEHTAQDLGWDPVARIVDTYVVGVDPMTMLTGPIPATRELLAENDMTVSDIDRFEVNEAFASVIASWLEETGADWERVNTWGGAIAHGHPLGATGAALLTKLAYQLEEYDEQYGLCTMCIGFGQGIASIVERAT